MDGRTPRTLASGINHFYEAHPVVHNKLFAISVLYCGIIRLPDAASQTTRIVVALEREHTSTQHSTQEA